jgi:Zn-finger protein
VRLLRRGGKIKNSKFGLLVWSNDECHDIMQTVGMKRILEKIDYSENLKENLQILQEMSTLRKSRSGLPSNL